MKKTNRILPETSTNLLLEKYSLHIAIFLLAVTLPVTVYTRATNICLTVFLTIFLVCVYIFFCFARSYFSKFRRLALLPDIGQIVALSVLIYLNGEMGLIFLVFFIPIVAIDSANLKTPQFIGIISFLLFSLVVTNYFQWKSTEFRGLGTFYLIVLIEILYLLGTTFVMRVISRDALSLKIEKENLQTNLLLLEKEKEEVTTLFDNIENQIFSLDKENNIIFLNKAARKSFPEIPEGGAPVSRLKFFKDGKPFPLVDSLDKKEKIYLDDLSIENQQGFSNITMTPLIDTNKAYQGTIIIVHSLSSEEELEKKKVEFASIASHEIRTPLTVIEGYLNLLLNEKKFKYDKETRTYLETLHDSSIDLMHLANDILKVTKIQQNTLKATLEKVDLPVLIGQIAEEWEPHVQKKNLELKVYNSEKISEIIADSVSIKEILGNLIENAIKFTEHGSITLAIKPEKETIVISVTDTGIGITKKEKEKLFKKFYQIDDWQTREKGGTGLGLYISSSLAKRMGGEITLESELGKGSTLSLIIPKNYPHEKDMKKYEKDELKTFIKNF